MEELISNKNRVNRILEEACKKISAESAKNPSKKSQAMMKGSVGKLVSCAKG